MIEAEARLEAALARGRWRDLVVITTAAVLVAVVAGLTGIYPVAFLLICAVFAVPAIRSTRAACTLVALTSPVVALGAVDVGFHLVPAYVFLALGLLGILWRAEWRALRPGLPDVLLAGFLGVAVVVSLANVGRVPATTVVDAVGPNAREVRSFAQLLAVMAMAGIYLLLRVGIRSWDDVTPIVRALVVATLFVGLYGVYQVIGRELDFPYTYVNVRRDPGSLPINIRYVRLNSTLQEASPLGQFMAIALFLGLAWSRAWTQVPSWLSRRIALATLAGAGGILVLTVSKSAWLAVLFWGAIAMWLLFRPGPRATAALVACCVLLIGLAGAALLSERAVRLLGQRPVASERFVRVGYWIAALKMIGEHPMGVGVGNYPFEFPLHASFSGRYEYSDRVTDAHNLFLEAGAETGILGGLLLAGFFLSLIARAWWATRRAPPGVPAYTAIGLLAAFGTGASMHLSYSVVYFPFEWVLAGLVGAAPGFLAEAESGQATRR